MMSFESLEIDLFSCYGIRMCCVSEYTNDYLKTFEVRNMTIQ